MICATETTSLGLTIRVPVTAPLFYMRFGALDEAVRIRELAKTLKHYREALPKMEDAVSSATKLYLEAFESEVRRIAYDELITEGPEAIRSAITGLVDVEIRVKAHERNAAYWPGGPIDVQELGAVFKISAAPGLNGDRKSIEGIEAWSLALLERHLRIRANEIKLLAYNLTPRSALRALKAIVDFYPAFSVSVNHLSEENLRNAHAMVVGMAAKTIREGMDETSQRGHHHERALDLSRFIRARADEIAKELTIALGFHDLPNGPHTPVITPE